MLKNELMDLILLGSTMVIYDYLAVLKLISEGTDRD